MDAGLAALLVAAVVELGQVVELEDELIVVRPDLEARTELDLRRLAFERRRRVEPGRGGGFGGSDWPGAPTPPDWEGAFAFPGDGVAGASGPPAAGLVEICWTCPESWLTIVSSWRIRASRASLDVSTGAATPGGGAGGISWVGAAGTGEGSGGEGGWAEAFTALPIAIATASVRERHGITRRPERKCMD